MVQVSARNDYQCLHQDIFCIISLYAKEVCATGPSKFLSFRPFLKFLPTSDVDFFPSNHIQLTKQDLGPALPSTLRNPCHFPKSAHNFNLNKALLSPEYSNHICSPIQKEKCFWPVNSGP